MAGCKEASNLFGDNDPDDPGGESLEPDDPDPTDPDEPTGSGDPVVYPAEYVEPHSGTDGHDTIDELDLLKVLNVETVAKAIEELHDRIQNDLMGGLKLGMYLDLDSIPTPDTEEVIYGDPETQNLRIVIADFNQYKNKMDNGDTNHIKFVFKNIPVEKTMRSGSRIRNAGGYPYDGNGPYAGTGTPVLRPYLEKQFLPGLKTALGIDVDNDTYFYTVKRDILIGSKDDGWELGTLEAEIFIDTYMEAKGYLIQEMENTHTQTALYQVDSDWATTTGRANGIWWTATPKLASGDNFYSYNNSYVAYKLIGVVPAFCIK
jgi:hypothetical protein